MPGRFKLKQLVQLGVALIFILIASYVAYAFFAGSHDLNTNKTSTANGSAEMCVKCHPSSVSSVVAGSHKNANCICHGYNVNVTSSHVVSVAHNMTKQIYCTNCHADYDSNGNITIYPSPVVSGLRQSAHYITNNTTTLYAHSQQFFNNLSYPRP